MRIPHFIMLKSVCHKGRFYSQIWMFFCKIAEGGGDHFRYKKLHCKFFGFRTVYFGRKFWKKCPKRGGGGGVISNPKNFIANLRKLAHIYELSQKKAQCNFQKVPGGEGQGRLGILQKNIHILG